MKKWNYNLSNTIRTIGAIPFMFFVFTPSLILMGFNLYFNLAIFDSVADALELSYRHRLKLKAIAYLPSVLLIMKPLLELLFLKTGSAIDNNERNYLKMMKTVSIGILGFAAIAYLISYLFLDVKTSAYAVNPNPGLFEPSMIETENKVKIGFFDFLIDLFSLGLSYFTETLAGFLLITVKDILFPDSNQKIEVKILNEKSAKLLKDLDEYLKQTPEQIRKKFVNNHALIKEEINRISSFNLNNFDGFDDEKKEFLSKKTKVINLLEESLKNPTLP